MNILFELDYCIEKHGVLDLVLKCYQRTCVLFFDYYEACPKVISIVTTIC